MTLDRCCRYLKNASFVAIVGALVIPTPTYAQDNGCRTGGSALANAYVRVHPLYARIFGDLASYVASNREHFVEDGDAIRCARLMSQALLNSAFQAYDPNELQRRNELNARIGAMGISPGPQSASPSAMFYEMAGQMSRLATALPRAAQGGPLQGHLTQEQAFAIQLLEMLLQGPDMRGIMDQIEPLLRELGNADYRLVLSIVQNLAQ